MENYRKFCLVAVRSDCIIDSTTARTCVRSARYARQSRRELNVPRRHSRTEGRFSRNVGKFRPLAENVKLNEAQINDVSHALADVPSLIIVHTKRLYQTLHFIATGFVDFVKSILQSYIQIQYTCVKSERRQKNANYLRFTFES